MVGVAVVSKWTLSVASSSLSSSPPASLNPHCSPAKVNLRTQLAAFRPQFRLFSRNSSSRRRLRASSSADSGIFLPHLVASMVALYLLTNANYFVFLVCFKCVLFVFKFTE